MQILFCGGTKQGVKLNIINDFWPYAPTRYLQSLGFYRVTNICRPPA